MDKIEIENEISKERPERDGEHIDSVNRCLNLLARRNYAPEFLSINTNRIVKNIHCNGYCLFVRRKDFSHKGWLNFSLLNKLITNGRQNELLIIENRLKKKWMVLNPSKIEIADLEPKQLVFSDYRCKVYVFKENIFEDFDDYFP
jgi:hypothetical protein